MLATNLRGGTLWAQFTAANVAKTRRHAPKGPVHVYEPGLELYCIELRTTRWDEMVRWYREVVGLKVLVRVVEDRYAILGGGGARLVILGRDAATKATPRWSLAFEAPDLTRVQERLAKAGATVPKPRADREGFNDITTSDPDGNRIRLFAWAETRLGDER